MSTAITAWGGPDRVESRSQPLRAMLVCSWSEQRSALRSARRQRRGWLYLHDARGRGPLTPENLPRPARLFRTTLPPAWVWALKQEKRIARGAVDSFP